MRTLYSASACRKQPWEWCQGDRGVSFLKQGSATFSAGTSSALARRSVNLHPAACAGISPALETGEKTLGICLRRFAAEASGQNKASSARPVVKKMGALSKSQRKNFQGNIGRYKLMGGREEFHNVDRNRHGRIFEPWHTFEVVITSSKNNCWVTVKNKGRRYRSVFASHAGNVGLRKAARKTEMATQRIAENVARKLKRLGVVCCEVTFRRIMKVETCLQAFQQQGLQVTRLTHQPRLPKGVPHKPRKQRRV